MSRARRRFRKFLQRSISIVLIGVLCLALTEALVYLSSIMSRSPLRGLENSIVDLAFQVREKNGGLHKYTTDDIVIIDIDDASIAALGRTQLWPRSYDATVIRNISEGNPKAIGIDFLYTEPDALSPVYSDMLAEQGFEDPQTILDALSTDVDLTRAIYRSEKVYLSFFDDNDRASELMDLEQLNYLRIITADTSNKLNLPVISYPVLPIESFSNGARGIGSIAMPSQQDGTVRKYQVLQQLPVEFEAAKLLVANFPVYMLLDELEISDSSVVVTNKGLQLSDSLTIPLDDEGAFRLNWLGNQDSIRYIPFYKVLKGRIPAEFFENKFVFFGTSASGLEDLKTVPSQTNKMPGVEVHAIALLNMLNGAFIVELDDYAIWPWLLLMSILLVALYMVIRPFLGFIISIGLALGAMFLFILWFFPKTSTLVPIVTVMLLTVTTYLLATLYTYFIRERKSRQLKYAFGSYVSPEVVEQIIKDSGSLQLGGQKKELTVLFSDIRGFTTYSEGLDPQQIVAMLNDYLSRMSDVIFHFRGTIDKFIGDAIMAIFGAPVYQADNADRACDVALEMIKELRDLNQVNASESKPPLQIGIGINTGDMTVGNIGSKKRFDYTVIGDSVNLGSRLEGLTKYFGVDVIVSETTKERVLSDQFVFRELAAVKVKGKDKPVVIYELSGKMIPGEQQDFSWLTAWEEALSVFKRGEMEKALALFEAFKDIKFNDGPASFYMSKCHEFLRNPETFTGVITMDGK